jgi:hypothetical protein
MGPFPSSGFEKLLNSSSEVIRVIGKGDVLMSLFSMEWQAGNYMMLLDAMNNLRRITDMIQSGVSLSLPNGDFGGGPGGDIVAEGQDASGASMQSRDQV